MSTSTSSQALASLVTHGKILADLLQRAQHKEGSTHGNDIIHEEVITVIIKLLNDINKAQGRAFFPKESIAKFLKKIQTTLEDLIKLDPDNKSEYETLAARVSVFSLARQFPAVASSSLTSTNCEIPPLDYPREEFSATFNNLNYKEKTILFCLSLLSATGASIKKRDLIYWWIGMDLIEDQLVGENLLAKLVSMGIIERTFGNKKFSNRYKINDSVCDMVKQEMSAFGSIQEEGSWSVMRSNKEQQQQQQQQQSPRSNSGPRVLERQRKSFTRTPTFKSHQDDKSVAEALLNVHDYKLNAKAFEWISKMKNVKVLHLGSWHHDPTNYILVEDVDLFKDLKNLGQVRFLSLQGISGITNLPDSIYKLENLTVLDLRACHNLESLPVGIDSLKKLTHLDLSECYLIRQLPAGVQALSELRVLKEFVISSAATDPKGGKPNKKLHNYASFCEFSDLSELSKLRKLTVRTRRMNFPTKQDLDTLCQMQQLKNLRIAWVGNPSDVVIDSSIRRFPTKLKKLELQAAPESTASLLLGLIGKQRVNCLEKLYIRGGGLVALDPKKHCFHHVKVVNL